MRFFPNTYPDFSDQSVLSDPGLYLTKAKQVASFINANIKHVEQTNIDGGLYVGPAGVAYALWYARV